MHRYILRGLNQPFEHELHAGLNTVGRNPTNEFRIPDPSVSSFHAEITVLEADGTVIVRDLQSTNGTFIEGQPVEEATLAGGQRLQFGTVEMLLVIEEYDVKI
ncbi:MAG: FHA domain-containing protein, partial [Verrucomicrobiae bacterium]|nr:FHA domain-containing protein [Verrucomicrobiae bacterium]